MMDSLRSLAIYLERADALRGVARQDAGGALVQARSLARWIHFVAREREQPSTGVSDSLGSLLGSPRSSPSLRAPARNLALTSSPARELKWMLMQIEINRKRHC